MLHMGYNFPLDNLPMFITTIGISQPWTSFGSAVLAKSMVPEFGIQ